LKFIIISTYYPHLGGITDFVDSLKNNLEKKHEVEVITFSRQYPKFLHWNGGKKKGENCFLDILNPLTWIQVGNYVNMESPDVVIFKYWHPYFALCFWFLARWVRVQKLCIIDNVYPHEWFLFSKRLTKMFFNKIDKFIVMSKTTERELCKLYSN
jgi:glycosyltransferase involved in cell wall biosynthesis